MANRRICVIPDCGKFNHSFGLCRNHKRRLNRHGDPLGGTGHGDVQKFLAKALSTDTDECIEWPYGKMGAGYGSVSHAGKMIGAHRYVCKIAHGPPPGSTYEAAHSCGFSGCVNKRHLRWATPLENNHDRHLHGTANQGERHGNSKLSDTSIVAIRQMLESGTPQRAIAASFGVHVMTISNIHRRKTWDHVKDT